MKDMLQAADEAPGAGTRAKIIAAASDLIIAGGSEAATTRAVAAAASVQAPVIYRLFGDKDGLLDAAAEHILAEYTSTKAQSQPGDDPVEDLRQSWDAHIAFGLNHPAVFSLVYASRLEAPSQARASGIALFRELVRRVARTGRLRVSEERAGDLLYAMVTGTILTLLGKSPEERADLSKAARQSAFAVVLSGETPPFEAGPHGAATALLACLDEVTALTPGEQSLFAELLHRIARSR